MSTKSDGIPVAAPISALDKKIVEISLREGLKMYAVVKLAVELYEKSKEVPTK